MSDSMVEKVNSGRIASITIPCNNGTCTTYHRALCRDGDWAIRSITWNDKKESVIDGLITYPVEGGLTVDEASKRLNAVLQGYADLGIACSATMEY